LTIISNEVKVRGWTRSIVLGKAKVMSYEDIKEARAKRAAKEIIKGKGKRGRRRKSTALEAGEPEPELEPELARSAKEVIKSKGKGGRKCKSAALEPAPSATKYTRKVSTLTTPAEDHHLLDHLHAGQLKRRASSRYGMRECIM
jgi:hypothetical protein